VQNPRHRLAGFRVAQLVPGLGPASARRLLDAMTPADDPVAVMQAFKPPAAAAADWAAWLAASGALQAAPWPESAALALRWYRPQLERLHEDAPIRLADLDQLLRIAASFTSRERFLAELTLDPPEATSDEAGAPHRDEDYLILSTMHSAKGQEWAAVIVLNAVDGCIPSDMATGRADEVEEERRLLHVAMTRAKHHLALLVPQRFYVTQQGKLGDRHLYASLTRFIPESLAPLFETLSPQTQRDGDERAVAAGPCIDVLAAVRSGF
jgi:DNA helicase-2/ATP-dependent DNA helicase PcrA